MYILESLFTSYTFLPVSQGSIPTEDKSKKHWCGFELHRKVEVVEKYMLVKARSPTILS